jgi:hypothetical protein
VGVSVMWQVGLLPAVTMAGQQHPPFGGYACVQLVVCCQPQLQQAVKVCMSDCGLVGMAVTIHRLSAHGVAHLPLQPMHTH